MKHDPRIEELTTWLEMQFPGQAISLQPLAGDASFRRYFRCQRENDEYVIMDAPPDREDCRPFVKVAETLAARGVRVPKILAQDLDQGFLILEDFGDQLLQNALNPLTAPDYYTTAMDALVQWQRHPLPEDFPHFNAEFATREMQLFLDWFLDRHCQLTLTAIEREVIEHAFALLAKETESQPQTLIHRDYHSRNLLVLRDQDLGIIDFQDAMIGPITYDLVSLLRDCYIAWPLEQVRAWALTYLAKAIDLSVLAPVEPEVFLHWFDWQGIQRHLKAIGIFARLHHRDHKSGYLPDIPRTLGYVMTITAKYPELSEFRALLAAKIPQEFRQ